MWKHLPTLVLTVNRGFGQHGVAWGRGNRVFSRGKHAWRFSWSSRHLGWGNQDTRRVFWWNDEVHLKTTCLSLDLEVGHLWPDLWVTIWPWRRSLHMNIDRMTNLLLNPLAKQLPEGGKRREREKPSSTLQKKKKKSTNSSCFKTQQACFSFIYFYINTLKDTDLSRFKSCQFALAPWFSSVSGKEELQSRQKRQRTSIQHILAIRTGTRVNRD